MTGVREFAIPLNSTGETWKMDVNGHGNPLSLFCMHRVPVGQ